ncbi:uncharacterized protein TNCV_4757881 [Trichonephila clavipes]|nr:uncharacterized protein TNCV_4757881 [Trichonephila clavipes]
MVMPRHLTLYPKEKSTGFEVKKLECIAHVQKRMGGCRLRALRNSMESRKLSDAKGISGHGRLTDNEISKLQQYYSLAIRQNMNSVPDTFKAVWAIYFHKLSTDSVHSMVYAQLVRILGVSLKKLNCWEKPIYISIYFLDLCFLP